MIKKLNIALVFILAVILLCPNMSFAGGGGGKGGGGSKKSAPKYYSYEDLRNELKKYIFFFANANKPSEALVDLGYCPYYPASDDKKKQIISVISANPTIYGISNNRKISAHWDDSREIAFDWNGFNLVDRGARGNLIFLRGNGMGADIVKLFSEFTHVAIVDNPYGAKVFESTPDTNVNVNDAASTWQHITYYTCKRIKTANNPQKQISRYQLECALEAAKVKYRGTPYFPKVETSILDILGAFVFRWCDKDDQNSMYCSKLVYNTFKDKVCGINFDTKRTGVNNCIIGDGNRPIGSGFFGWFGISPADIYYSSLLESDFFYSGNVRYL